MGIYLQPKRKETCLRNKDAKRIKFKIEFMLLMATVGRIEESQKALQDILDVLNLYIEDKEDKYAA